MVELAKAYAKEEEGLRVVETEMGSKFNIVRDRSTGLWNIQVSSGTVPAPLRGRYTHHLNALTDIQNYVDGHGQRKIEYKKVREQAAAN